MGKLIPLLAATLLLTTPAWAADGPDSRSPDPDTCQHEFDETVVSPANCSQAGLIGYTCSLCGFTYTEQTEPNGEHDYLLTDTTATCTEPGEALFTCSRCGETYTEPAPAAGHVPEDGPVDCLQSRCCAVCGQVLEPATGHDYAYQFDAQLTSDGQFLSYGTWRCANCGKELTATRGNALYYYGEPQASETAQGSDTDLTAAGGTYDDASPTDGEAAGQRQTGLWLAISAGVLAFILIEAVLLIRSLRKNRTTI